MDLVTGESKMTEKGLTQAGLEPTISCSVGRRLIHWATEALVARKGRINELQMGRPNESCPTKTRVIATYRTGLLTSIKK